MTIQPHYTPKKILKVSTGVILLSISSFMALGPTGLRSDSGLGYIVVVGLLTIGALLVVNGLFDTP